jgi:hypothetical protein
MRRKEMKISRINTVVIVLFLSAMTTAVNGQNSLSSPAPLVKNQTTVSFNGDNTERFYSFTRKGNVFLTFDVNAQSDNGGVYIDFLNTRGRSLAPQEVVQGVNSGTERVVKKLQLDKKYQTVVLKVKSISYGSRASYPGSLKITFGSGYAHMPDRVEASGGFSRGEADFETTTDIDWVGSNIDTPRMLNTRYSLMDIRGDNREQFIAFYAEGIVNITYDIKAKGINSGANIFLLDRQGEELTEVALAQAVNKGTGRATQTVTLSRRQQVIIKVVSISYGNNPSYQGALKITLNSGYSK